MLKDRPRSTTLFCFSPAAMLWSFAAEFGLAVYLLSTKKLDVVGWLSVGSLTLLGIFQLAEYQICGGVSPILWAKIGFVAITLLPALGLDIISRLAKPRVGWLVPSGYLIASLFIVGIGAIGIEPVCGGNYAIFKLDLLFMSVYGVYYFTYILLGLVIALSKSKNHRKARYAMALGYLTFLVPTAIVLIMRPNSIDGVPSIMCGFALIFALVLAIVVVPLSGQRSR